MVFATTLFLASLAFGQANQQYRIFPQRTSEEAAVIEWGHSAIISALDGAVATFGPQTTQGASFEVETAVVLANPIDGVGRWKSNNSDETLSDFEREYPGKLKNAADVEGNMLIMTDAAGLSGVTMARCEDVSHVSFMSDKDQTKTDAKFKQGSKLNFNQPLTSFLLPLP